MKMELIECSETSAYNNQTPGKYPKEYIQKYKYLIVYVHLVVKLKDIITEYEKARSGKFHDPLALSSCHCTIFVVNRAPSALFCLGNWMRR